VNSAKGSYLNVGWDLTVSFVVLVALILGGNGLLIWQFVIAREQTERLTEVSRELTAVLRVQETLLQFHQRLDEIGQSKDAGRLATEAKPLLMNLLEQTRQTRKMITRLPIEAPIDPLEAIEVTLPSQLEEIATLAKSGDWEAANLRLTNQLKPMEAQMSAVVDSIDHEVSGELKQAVTNMANLQRRIFYIVPTTAILTFGSAAFFGWSLSRRIIELRLEERVTERTRIARELHDTLLQSLHGLMFQFQAARNMLPGNVEPAMRALDDAILGTEQAIAESRDAIQELRPEPAAPRDLARMLAAAGQEFAGITGGTQDSVAFEVIAEGEPQPLHPARIEEIYRIGRELIRNAFHHANAKHIEVEVRYDEQQLRLRIRDDGKGIDAKVLESKGRAGHWGLPGVRERAQQIGATLDFWSEVGAGTEAELRVPAGIAYEKVPDRPRFRLYRKAGRRDEKS